MNQSSTQELLNMAVAELEKYKDDLQTKLDKVKTFCKNNPAKCGKQEKGE